MPKKVKCQFCRSEIEEPVSMNEVTRICPHCRAIYWLESADDLYLVTQDAADHFEIEYEQMFEQIETKVVRNFDVLKDNEEDNFGEEICLVFAHRRK